MSYVIGSLLLANQAVKSTKLTLSFNVIFSFDGKVMMRVSKQRLFNFEEMFVIAFRAESYALVSGSNTSYGNSLGKAPLIPALRVLFECLGCFLAFLVKFWEVDFYLHYGIPAKNF